jgi:hypothetical protein
LHTKKNLSKNLKTLNEGYKNYIEELREGFEDFFCSDFFSEYFVDMLDEILCDENLDQYSDEKFYWINLIESLLTLDDLLEEGDEEEVFSFFEESEYTQIYLELSQKNLDPIECADEIFHQIEENVLSFYLLHLFEGQTILDQGIRYKHMDEFGESLKSISIGTSGKRLKLPKGLNEIILRSVDTLNFNIEIEVKGKIVLVDDAHESSADLSNELIFIKTDALTEEESQAQVERIKKAMVKLKKFTPEAFEFFNLLTKKIIPTRDKEIVSYSMQTLPGYSVINLFDRDDLDLLDDLLHENGHHILNTFLNLEELIFEDDDKIFYSPWRRALRPIRGIYHAYCTFVWAHKLYYDLAIALDSHEDFSEAQKQKIYFRALEEFTMLNYTYEDLLKAFSLDKISERGMDVIEFYRKDFLTGAEKLKNLISFRSKLSSESEKELVELESHLAEMKRKFIIR